MRAGIKAIQRLLSNLKEKGSTKDILDDLITMDEHKRITGLSEIERLEDLYLPEEK